MKNQPIRIGTPQGIPNRHRGFTLVELLVVITIIAALAGVGFTLTQKIKASAYRTNAMSSLRQVTAFNMAYSTENNGDINTLRWDGDAKEGKPGWVSATYWGRLQPYLFPDAASTNQSQLNKNINQRMDQLFNSPDADKMTNTVLSGVKIYHDVSGLPVPFAFNSYLVPWDKFAKMSSFNDPSQILYFGYGFGMFNEADGKAYSALPNSGEKTTNNIYYLDDRKAIMAFLDGHVESLSAPMPDRNFK